MGNHQEPARHQISDKPRPGPSSTAGTRPRSLPGAAFLFAVLSLLWGIVNVLGVLDRARTSAERTERLLTAIINFACVVGLFKLRKFGLYLAYLASVLFGASGVVYVLTNPNDPTHAAARFVIGVAWLAYFLGKRKLFS